jgi:hypothetical protein
MKRFIAPLFTTALMFIATAAFGFTLRAPQVAFNGGSLQGYLNSLGEAIDVNTMQADVQAWSTNVTGNSDFTLTKKNGVADEVGVYNASDPAPTLFMVFPSGATDGWHAQMHFTTTSLSVTLFDDNNVIQGQTTYPGVNKLSFGFYIKSLNGTFYSQDGRNGGSMVLTYAGVSNPGDWWLCFQDVAYPTGDRTFDSAVLNIQSVRPTPTRSSTWGNLKSRYR